MARGKNHKPRDRGARPIDKHCCRLMLVALGLACSVGCGYRFRVGDARLPDGSQKISIPMAKNQTPDVSAGIWLTSVLRREAKLAGLMVTHAQEDTARLEANVLSIKSVPRGVAIYGGRYRSQEQELVVKVSLKLKLASGEMIRILLDDREGYLSAPDLRGTETNRMVSLMSVLERIAKASIRRVAGVF